VYSVCVTYTTCILCVCDFYYLYTLCVTSTTCILCVCDFYYLYTLCVTSTTCILCVCDFYYLYTAGVWSKPLVNTDGTEIVDIHMIRLPRPGFTPIDLDPSIGTVHHYRALSHDSLVLAQSPQYNVLKRNTHIYKDQVKQILPSMCNFNNPNIGEMNFAD